MSNATMANNGVIWALKKKAAIRPDGPRCSVGGMWFIGFIQLIYI
jgi:hypothetical protein